MPKSLYVLANPRRDSEDVFWNPSRRRAHRKGHRRRNPSDLVVKVQDKALQGASFADILIGAGAMVATEKVGAAAKTAAAGQAQLATADKVVEIAASGLTAVALGFLGKHFANRGVGTAAAIGGGITTLLNVVKYIPALQTLVAPGSLVIGGRPQALPRAASAGLLGPGAGERARVLAGQFTPLRGI